MKEYKISREIAEQDFDRFCEKNRIDNDVDDFSEEDQKAFDEHKKRIVKAIMKGEMVINDASEAEFCGVKFKTPKGRVLLAMDRSKKGQDMKAQFEVMADICEVPAATFSKMDSVDVKVCMAVTALFLGS